MGGFFFVCILKNLHVFTLFKMESFNPRLIPLPLAPFSPFLLSGKRRDYDIHSLLCSVVYFNNSCSELLPKPPSNRWPVRKLLSCCSFPSFKFTMVSPSSLLCTAYFLLLFFLPQGDDSPPGRNSLFGTAQPH